MHYHPQMMLYFHFPETVKNHLNHLKSHEYFLIYSLYFHVIALISRLNLVVKLLETVLDGLISRFIIYSH